MKRPLGLQTCVSDALTWIIVGLLWLLFLSLEFEMRLGLQECEGQKTEDRDIECTYILRLYTDRNIYSPSHFQKETTLTVKKKKEKKSGTISCKNMI